MHNRHSRIYSIEPKLSARVDFKEIRTGKVKRNMEWFLILFKMYLTITVMVISIGAIKKFNV